ncbi:MAG: hypothetical protein H6Q51_1123 [Deltaproteobacteria bacterium]|nr:hypothetical protein [Deltaproteobacteria bacterium]
MVDEHTDIHKLIEERVAAEQGEQPATGQATDEYHIPSNAGPGLTETYESFSSTEIIQTLRENEVGAAWIHRRLYSQKYRFDHSNGRWHKFSGPHYIEDGLNEALADCDKVACVFDMEGRRQSCREATARKAGRDGEARDAEPYESSA